MFRRAAVVLLLSSCNDYDLNEKEDVDGGKNVPAIEVTPHHIIFEPQDVVSGESETRPVTIRNVGKATLDIENVWIVGDPASFTLGPLAVSSLEPDASTELAVTFQPVHSLDIDSVLEVQSNDPNVPLSEVELSGDGLAPDLVVTPTVLDLGALLPGCVTSQDIVVENVGDAPLQIEDASFSAGSAEITWTPIDRTLATLPWTLAPGERVGSTVTYAPLAVGETTGLLQVRSNDPLEAIETSDVTALATLDAIEDVFEQPTDPSTDILFVIDNSSSMDDEQASISSNGTQFIATMNDSDVDWHIAVITTSSDTLRGEYLSQATPNVEDEFVAQISAGTNGAHHEHGIETAYDALQSGGTAGPGTSFYRDEARLVIVFVSDEEEQSIEVEPAEAAAYFNALKPTDDGVLAHSVIALPGDGCSVETYGYRYEEVTNAVGGIRTSICGTWSDTMAELADSASFSLDRFGLSQIPKPETIEVTVNGIGEAGWTYDTEDNAVVMDADRVPMGGSEIVIRYEIGDCEQ